MNNKLTILTHSPRILSKEYVKALVKKLMGRMRGPNAVAESLHRGLQVLNVPHLIDPPINKISDTVHVISGIEALRFAIKLKKNGKIKKLIAGPTLVITPFDNDKIILSPEIDIIVCASAWPKDFFVSLVPELDKKIIVWPAGISIPETISTKNGPWVIYNKIGHGDSISESIKKSLSDKHISWIEICYGEFKQKEYFYLLASAQAVVYLSHSESQGLALQEAWARNVPTLVYTRGYWEYGTHRWDDSKISAPYLNDQSGSFFKDITEFEKETDYLQSHIDQFTPRSHVEKNLSDIKTTEQLLKILEL